MPSISEITMKGSGNASAGDEIEFAAARVGGVEVLVDELLHARAQLLDRARREHLRHQSPQTVMVGRVEVQHRVRAALAPFVDHRLDVGVGRERQRLHVPLLDAQARVAQHVVHVGVAEQRPRPDRAEVHGIRLAHELVLRVRIVEEAGLERVEHHRQIAGVLGRFARSHGREATPANRSPRSSSSVRWRNSCRILQLMADCGGDRCRRPSRTGRAQP